VNLEFLFGEVSEPGHATGSMCDREEYTSLELGVVGWESPGCFAAPAEPPGMSLMLHWLSWELDKSSFL
jgi:hypothetical protein